MCPDLPAALIASDLIASTWEELAMSEATKVPDGWVTVGVDVAEERKGLDLVALDSRRVIVSSHRGLSVGDAVHLLADEIRPVVVCIDSPPGWAHSGKSRAAERELARIGFSAFPVGADPGDHPFYRWMRVGIALYEALSKHYPRYRHGELLGKAVEVFPNASAQRLAGHPRPAGVTKTAFRRSVLASQGVDETKLANLDQIDAALAALTGLVALLGHYQVLGDPLDGVIVLPDFNR